MHECEFRKLLKTDSVYRSVHLQSSPAFYKKNPGPVVYETIINAVKSELLFGMVECDISIPEEWPKGCEKSLPPFQYFSEMSPIFATCDIPFDKIGEHMKNHARNLNLSEKPRKLLVGGTRAEKILLATPLLKWYLEKGLQVTKIYEVVEFTPKKCYKSFVDLVSDARRAGDINPDQAIIGDSWKLIGNCAYGSLILNQEKFSTTKYVADSSQAQMEVNNPRFKKCMELSKSFYEIEQAKRVIPLNLPTFVGFFILQNAKKILLSFYYDCLDVLVERSDFELLECDTDALYYSASAPDFESLVKPECKELYHKSVYGNCNDKVPKVGIDLWFPRQCCEKHAMFDKRLPGAFKPEATGTFMQALCSKTYILADKGKYKLSCKGLNKRRVHNPKEIFQTVLETQKSISSRNVGFKTVGSSVYTYIQERIGFQYFYCKRRVLDCGIRTMPLDLTLSPCPKYNVYFVEDESNPLSNMYVCQLEFNGRKFNSAEQAYLYEMAKHCRSEKSDVTSEILNAKSPWKARDYVKQIKENEKWLEVRKDTMYDILLCKLNTVPGIKETLTHIDSRQVVIIGLHDRVWTSATNKYVAELTDPSLYPGQNLLGKLWDSIRIQHCLN